MARPAGNAVQKQLQLLRTSVGQAERALRRLTPLVRELERNGSGAAAQERRHKIRITPRRLRVLKLQGEYMGCLRHLQPRHHARVKAEKAKHGFPAAIKLARSLAPR